MYFILLFDNCPMHKGFGKDEFWISNVITEKKIIILLPPNVTCCFQPKDMGIISLFNIIYCVRVLETILSIFDIEESYETLEYHWRNTPMDCNFIIDVGKPKIIDYMFLCYNLCNSDAKYAFNTNIRNLWVKAEIFTPNM